MTSGQRRKGRPGLVEGGRQESRTCDGKPARVVSSIVLGAIVTAVENVGVDTCSLVSDLGLERGDIVGTDRLYSAELEEALWAELLERRRDRAFGLAAAEALGRGAFRGLEYVCRTSNTLGDALDRLTRFNRILHGVDEFSLNAAAQGSRELRYESPLWENSLIAPYIAEFALASIVVIGRDAAGTSWAPTCVMFEHAAPEDTRPYEVLFRCPIGFGELASGLVFHRTLLETPMREADPVLCSVLESSLRRTLDELDHDPGIADAVRSVVAKALPGGPPGLEQVARQIGLSRRTLQKRLREERVTFNELLDEVRANLARLHLLRGWSVPEIALLLGYSDASAFQRAFKRWTGMTPAMFRRGGER